MNLRHQRNAPAHPKVPGYTGQYGPVNGSAHTGVVNTCAKCNEAAMYRVDGQWLCPDHNLEAHNAGALPV